MNTLVLLVMLGISPLKSDVPAHGSTAAISQNRDLDAESGIAAVYSSRLVGHRMANGQPYDPSRLIAAHKSLPFGTRVQVTNLGNGKQVELTITDRGPRQAGRILDLSPRAARSLGIRFDSIDQVELRVLASQ